jgi:hypothetical protein
MRVARGDNDDDKNDHRRDRTYIPDDLNGTVFHTA